MGIHGFTKLVEAFASECIENKEFITFAGQIWGLDGSIFMYKFGHDPMYKKKTNPVIDGFYRLFHRLYSCGIQPMLILDGKKPKQKLYTIQQRQKKTQGEIDKVTALQHELIAMLGANVIKVSNMDQSIPESDEKTEFDTIAVTTNGPKITLTQLVEMYKGHPIQSSIESKLNEIKIASKNIIQFQPDIYKQIYKLCELMGVPVLRANWEADALCAKLYQQGKIDMVMSEDSDILLYNGQLARKFNWGNSIEVINPNKLFSSLGITYEQFIDLATLCGTDYTVATITQIGFKTAVDLIINQKLNIEQIIDKINGADKKFKKYSLPTDTSHFDYKLVRELINNAHSLENEIDIKSINKGIDHFQLDELKAYMNTMCNYKSDTIQKHYIQILNAPKIYVAPVPLPKLKITLKKDIKPLIDNDIKSSADNDIKPTLNKIKIALKPKLTLKS